MTKNRGTFEGNKQEMEVVMNFNSNKFSTIFKEYISNFNNYDINKLFMVRVSTEQFSKLSNQIVKTRADAYLIYSDDTKLNNLLLTYNNYLDENILKNNNVSYSIIYYSGISIKLSNSKNFQILKLTPNSFCALLGNFELGAGACLFCEKDNELQKNYALINGWFSSIEKMEKYFSSIINSSTNFYLDKDICKRIKKYSQEKIKTLINNSKELQGKIFNGINIYEEPYVAYYFYHNNQLTKLTYIPFNITNGSGRSQGKYTLVLKPK